jgi:hypothetical protein
LRREERDAFERCLRFENLAGHPIGGGLDLFLEAGVLLQMHAAVGAVAARPRRVGQNVGRLEEKRREDCELAVLCLAAPGRRDALRRLVSE